MGFRGDEWSGGGNEAGGGMNGARGMNGECCISVIQITGSNNYDCTVFVSSQKKQRTGTLLYIQEGRIVIASKRECVLWREF
jgi:hypothetical protein